MKGTTPRSRRCPYAHAGSEIAAKRLPRLRNFKSCVSTEQRLSSLPGARYFQEQRIRGEAEKRLHGWLSSTCDKVVGGLEAIVSEIYARKVLPGRIAGTSREMFCNWAVLIARENLPILKEHISLANASYASSGLLFELSGPWPPYSFCRFPEWEARD